MNKKDLDTWNDLYLSVYDEEQLDEKVGTALDAANQLDKEGRGIAAAGLRAKAARVARGEDKPKVATDSGKGGQVTLNTAYPSKLNNEPGVTRYQPIPGQPGRVARYFTPDKKQPVVPTATKPVVPTATKPVVPTATKPVVPTATKPVVPTATKPATERSPQGYAVGTTAGGTKFERRTPTRKEMDAAKGAGGGEAGVKAAVAAGQPTTGPANATIDKGSVAASMAAFNPTAPIKPATPASTVRPGGFGASTSGLNAAASTSSVTAPLKPSTPINSNNKPKLQMNSYKWSSEKTAGDVASAYASIYEAKKKVDQDEDNDNDFADVRIARMIASGVPKAKAIAMVKDKSYNKKDGLDEATAMAKRGQDETAIRNKIAKSTGGGKFADKATELENRPTFGDGAKKAAREKLARTQRGDFRRTTSSDYGLRLGAHKSDDPAVKAKQAARGKQRSALTPNEKKMLNREAYAAYEFVASYLLENNFATTIEDADVIIKNMSENWFTQIIEG